VTLCELQAFGVSRASAIAVALILFHNQAGCTWIPDSRRFLHLKQEVGAPASICELKSQTTTLNRYAITFANAPADVDVFHWDYCIVFDASNDFINWTKYPLKWTSVNVAVSRMGTAINTWCADHVFNEMDDPYLKNPSGWCRSLVKPYPSNSGRSGSGPITKSPIGRLKGISCIAEEILTPSRLPF